MGKDDPNLPLVTYGWGQQEAGHPGRFAEEGIGQVGGETVRESEDKAVGGEEVEREGLEEGVWGRQGGRWLRLVKPDCSLRQISPDTKMAGSLVKAGNRGMIPLPPSTPGVLDAPAPQPPL